MLLCEEEGPGQAGALFMAGTKGFQGAAGSFWLVSGSRKMVGSRGGGQSISHQRLQNRGWCLSPPRPPVSRLSREMIITWAVPRIRDVMDIWTVLDSGEQLVSSVRKCVKKLEGEEKVAMNGECKGLQTRRPRPPGGLLEMQTLGPCCRPVRPESAR